MPSLIKLLGIIRGVCHKARFIGKLSAKLFVGKLEVKLVWKEIHAVETSWRLENGKLCRASSNDVSITSISAMMSQ